LKEGRFFVTVKYEKKEENVVTMQHVDKAKGGT